MQLKLTIIFSLCLVAFAFDPIAMVQLKPRTSSYNERVLEMDTFKDWAYWTFFGLLTHLSIFFVFGSVLEYTNPIPKTPQRIESIKA